MPLLRLDVGRVFGKYIGESEAGTYNRKVDGSFRFDMAWFILSEVMFFASFFVSTFNATPLGISRNAAALFGAITTSTRVTGAPCASL